MMIHLHRFWVVVALNLIHSGEVESILVMRFQEDGVASNTTMAEYPVQLDRSRMLNSVTFCARFKIFFIHSRGTFLKLEDKTANKGAMLRGELWIEKVRPVIAHTWNFQILPENLWAFRWYHICFTYDHITNVILTYLDGKVANEQVFDVGKPIRGDYLNLGQGSGKSTSFSGDLTQVNVWDEVLRPDEIHDIASCKTDPHGNFVSWFVEWKLKDITSYEMQVEDLCNKDVGTSYFWFPRVSHLTSQYICEAFGTHLPMVKSKEELTEILALGPKTFPDSKDCHIKLWTAIDDKEEDGTWKYDYNGEVETGGYWSPGEPNGLIYENCAAISVGGLVDIDCKTNIRCAVCTFKEQKRFSFLGICEEELRNIYFVAYKSGEEDLIFMGYGEYHIRIEMGQWVWLDVVNNRTIARMEDYVPNYPMGRRFWTLEREVCGQPPGGLRSLLLTPCAENQYTCDDASCIPLTSRCDLRYDCKDKSDEIGCNPVAFPEDYQQHLPPRPNQEEDTSLPIFIDTIIEALDVKTLQMTTEVTYTVRMTWKENRVDYLNVKENKTLNFLPFFTFKDLWTPNINFVNTNGNQHTEVDNEAQMFINRLYGANKRDEAAPAEVEVFFGEFNTISIQRKYTTVYSCMFDLQLYPFDNQQCEMQLSITSAPTTFLYFKEKESSVSFLKVPKLIEYEVGELGLEVDNTGFYSEAKIIIPLSRRAGYAILNIYTPSLVLLIVSYVTLFFRPTLFDVRMMAALTAQLVIATFFSQVSATLPKTSYVKMVDVWLLFCIGITFLVIILHAIVDTLINEPYDKNASSSSFSFGRFVKIRPQGTKVEAAEETLNSDPKHRGHQMVLASKVIVLSLFIFFNLVYWSYILL